MTLEKTFDEINEADIRQLIEDEVSERKTIEYKECLPDDKHDSKKEFLADVSSFANTIGGHLLYGIKEENGLPIALIGVSNNDLDREILRLENLLRDNIQPRCPGINIRSIDRSSMPPFVIIRIPQSWSKPHVVNFQGHWRFYARNSAGKYPLDVMELKSAFLTTNALGERIKSFHFDRLSKIAAGETPLPLINTARLVFHVIPYSAFEARPPLSFIAFEKEVWSLATIYSSISGYRYNLDGLVTYSEKEDNLFGAYTQVFRNGIIEAVTTTMFRQGDIPSIVFEQKLIESLQTYISIYQKLSVSPPSVLIVSLLGVKGYELAVKQHLNFWHERHVHKIDRDSLLLPEVIVEDDTIVPTAILRPIFDALWNSAGWPRSLGYDDAGEWGKGPNF